MRDPFALARRLRRSPSIPRASTGRRRSPCRIRCAHPPPPPNPHPSRERTSRVAVARPAASAASVLFPISLSLSTHALFVEFALTLASVLEICLKLNTNNCLMVPQKVWGFNWTTMSYVRSAWIFGRSLLDWEMSLGYAEKLSYREDVGNVGMPEIFDSPELLHKKVGFTCH